METKICGKCKTIKSLENFHRNKNYNDGFYYWCKTCKQEYDFQRRKTQDYKKIFETEEYKERKRKYYENRKKQNPSILLFNYAKIRARKNNLPFNLEPSDIIIPSHCPILNIPLFMKNYDKNDTKSFRNNSPSLDRIIPKLGYVKGNVIVMSMKANAMKNNATKDELIKFCTNILKIYDKNNIDININ